MMKFSQTRFMDTVGLSRQVFPLSLIGQIYSQNVAVEVTVILRISTGGFCDPILALQLYRAAQKSLQ